MSNNWNQFPASNQNSEANGAPPKSGLLRDYRPQSQQQLPPQVVPSAPLPRPSGSLQPGPFAPSGPLHPGTFAPPTTSQPGAGPQRPGGVAQQWMANTVQAVRQWTGKMTVLNGYVQQPPPQPMILYRPSGPPSDPGMMPLPKIEPWKRSLALRLTMQRRHRRGRQVGISPVQVGTYVGVTIIALLVIILSSSGAYAYSYYQSQLPRLQQLASQHINQTTRIYDRNGALLYELYDQGTGTGGTGGGRRTPISYDDVPQMMQTAMISAEDATFWTNAGIEPQGILRAAISQSSGGGGGASTITQQLIKKMTGDDSLTYQRKIVEASLAIGLTQQYTKAKILEMYFNLVPFGSQDLGVEAAVEDYFNLKPQCDANFKCKPAIAQLAYNQDTKKNDPILELARASLLAGMPQSPYFYDPTLPSTSSVNFRQNALDRQKYVLEQMVRLGFHLDDLSGPVTPAIAQQAEDLTAKMKFTHYNHSIRAPHFVFWVINQLAAALGAGTPGTAADQMNAGLVILAQSGFNIRTTIDANLEDYVENAVKRHITQPEYQLFPYYHLAQLNRDNNLHDAAVVVEDPKTGEILAMDGSVDYNDTDPKVAGQQNVVTSPRPPGSTFKPIVYATSFQQGWYPGMVLPDFQTFFPNGVDPGTIADPAKSGVYQPPDYGGDTGNGGGYSQISTTIRRATAESRNVPAVKAITFTGLDAVVNNARLMGVYSIDKDMAARKALPITDQYHCDGTIDSCYGASMALGPTAITPLEMAGVYQTFANGGKHIPTQGILDIWDNYGHNVYHFDPAHVKETQVFTPQIAYMMTSVLTDEYARRAEFLNDHDLSFTDWEQGCAMNLNCAHQVAAKTGTTDNFKDNWTMGYTPNIVVGVWAGNADGNDPMDGNVVGITGAAPIWHSIIERVERGSEYCTAAGAGDNIPCGTFNYNFTQHTFPVPQGIHQACVSPVDGLQGQGDCDWVLDGQDPQQAGASMSSNNKNGNNGSSGSNGNNGNNNGSNNNSGNNNGNGNGTGN